MAKTKVPKRVGGVKIPKKMRRQAKRAIALVETPAVRDLAIAGLTMAAGRLAARDGAAQVADRDDRKLGEMLRESAIEGARRFLAGFEEGRRKAEAEADMPPARKPSVRARRPAAPAARG